MSKRPKYLLRVRIAGPGVRSKSISVPDLLKLCKAIQSAVYRQAEAMEGKRSLRTGPITGTAQEECTLELIGIGKGSTTLSFRQAKPQQHLPMPGSTQFGADVVGKVAATVRALGTQKRQPDGDVDFGVLDSLKELGDMIGGRSITEINFTVPRHNGTPKVKAVFNKLVHERIIQMARSPQQQEMTFEGRLEMADFKETGKSCRLHPPLGQAIQCTLDPAKEDEVYEALRKPVRLSGTAKTNPNTGKLEGLHIQKIEILEELMLGVKDFFASHSLEHLAQTQGVKPLIKPRVLEGGWPEEEDLDEFLTQTYESRSA